MQQRILLIQLRQLGDILLTTPCVREIKRKNPGAHVTFLSHPMGRLVLEGCPYVDEFFTYQPDSWWGEWQLSKQIRTKKFDLVIDFMNNPRSAFYCMRSGARERIAFQSRRNWAYSEVVRKPGSARYIVQEKFELLRAAGFDPKDERLLLPWHEQHAGPTLKFFNGLLRSDCPRFALSPTHRRTNRRWPLERYAALADHLVKEWGGQVTWLWGPGEERLVDQVRALCTEVTRKSPPTSFREMAALVANHDCFIGNSNGPSHVAVAADVPSLQIHGPTNPLSWCPMTERHQALGSDRRKTVPAEAIQDVSLRDVIDCLEHMRPVVEHAVAHRNSRGPRLSWRNG